MGSIGGIIHDGLGFFEDTVKVGFIAHAFRVDLGDRLGATGAGGKPAVFGGHLQSADRSIVSGCPGQDVRSG